MTTVMKKRRKRKICFEEGCETPVNYKKGGMRNRCQKHGGYPQCSFEGCETPVNYMEGGIRGRCQKHGGIPQCSDEGCETPVLYKEGGIRGRCIRHGGYPQCSFENCETPVLYKEGGIRGRCIRHGGYPECSVEGCETPVQYREGGLRGRCRKHGGLPKCSSCSFWSVHKLGFKCSYCRPDSATAKRSKKEEEAVAKVLNDAGIIYQREVQIHYGCNMNTKKQFARLDFVIEGPQRRVILEVDERQHQDTTYNIECDLSRMMYVMSAISLDDNDRPTFWIRFNPNAFKVDGKTKRVPKKIRYTRLIDLIRGTDVGVVYMYYDVSGGNPCITQDPLYSTSMKALLKPCVY